MPLVDGWPGPAAAGPSMRAPQSTAELGGPSTCAHPRAASTDNARATPPAVVGLPPCGVEAAARLAAAPTRAPPAGGAFPAADGGATKERPPHVQLEVQDELRRGHFPRVLLPPRRRSPSHEVTHKGGLLLPTRQRAGTQLEGRCRCQTWQGPTQVLPRVCPLARARAGLWGNSASPWLRWPNRYADMHATTTTKYMPYRRYKKPVHQWAARAR